MTPPPAIRLTSLAHGGGCGCKLAPDMLRSLLAGQAATGPFERLLVGNETADDAAVWALEDGTCIIATTDFFMPMVDDPFEFGRIAAANAISDVYATGGTPIMALAILGMPVGKIEPEIVSRILAGGAAICAEAGIPVAGGHSIDNPEPVYGLAVIGTARREHVRRNADARAGDALILTKRIGVGIYSAAFKRDALSPEAYREFIATTTQLNKVGAILARDPNVHMLTDVTGFGLLGHGLEVARGGNVTVVIEWDAVPLLQEAERLAKADFVTGASHRNWASYGDHVRLPADVAPWQRHLLSDPQTSGGLLIACAPERQAHILEQLASEGFRSAARIGRVSAGVPEIRVET